MHNVVIDDTNTDVVGNDLLQLSAKGIKLIAVVDVGIMNTALGDNIKSLRCR